MKPTTHVITINMSKADLASPDWEAVFIRNMSQALAEGRMSLPEWRVTVRPATRHERLVMALQRIARRVTR